MKKTINWIIWSLVLIVINMGAFPIALFSLFGTAEGTSIFSLDYLIAFLIMLLANIVTIQLFVSIRKQKQKAFLIGLVLAIIEICGFVLFIYTGTDFMICLALVLISIIGAAVLLGKGAFARN